MHELKIAGGQVIDGTGAAPRPAEVGVSGGRITDVAEEVGPARAVIEADGLYVAPGFIDAHSHADGEGVGSLLHAPEAPSAILQGVTTVIAGMCGFSPLLTGAHLDAVAEKGAVLNLGVMIGHNSIRKEVLGLHAGAPTPTQLTAMRDLVAAGMRQGARGLSTGLWYVPGAYARIEEIVALARVAAEFGGVYASHLRSENAETGPAALAEAIEIGRQAQIPVEVAHLKAAERPAWGQGPARLAMLEQARAEGVDIHADAYPYDASSTNLNVLLPAEAFEEDGLRAKLADPARAREYRAHIADRLERIGGPDRVIVALAAARPEAAGRRLGQLAAEVGQSAEDLVIDLVVGGHTSAIYFSMDQADVDMIVEHPLVMIGSDSSVRRPGEGVCHPRTWGTFVRVLARYARERKTLAWGEAIHRMTGLPARKFGLTDRGVLQPGAWADLVLFDPQAVQDRATYDDPHAAPSGIRRVLVNGETVVVDGEIGQARPGQVLRKRQR